MPRCAGEVVIFVKTVRRAMALDGLLQAIDRDEAMKWWGWGGWVGWIEMKISDPSDFCVMRWPGEWFLGAVEPAKDFMMEE